jgi:hypothetical protein
VAALTGRPPTKTQATVSTTSVSVSPAVVLVDEPIPAEWQQRPDPILMPALCSNARCAGVATELWYEIPLCARHRANIAAEINIRADRNVVRAAEKDGWAYILEYTNRGLPVLKVGFSGFGRLRRRMTDLKRELGEITVLSVEPGGRVRESTLHLRWKHFMLPGLGERFADADEIRGYALETGIAPDALREIDSLIAA